MKISLLPSGRDSTLNVRVYYVSKDGLPVCLPVKLLSSTGKSLCLKCSVRIFLENICCHPIKNCFLCSSGVYSVIFAYTAMSIQSPRISSQHCFFFYYFIFRFIRCLVHFCTESHPCCLLCSFQTRFLQKMMLNAIKLVGGLSAPLGKGPGFTSSHTLPLPYRTVTNCDCLLLH